MRTPKEILDEIVALPPMWKRREENPVTINGYTINLFNWQIDETVASRLDRLESELELAE